MDYAHGTAIKTLTSGDGAHYVDIVARVDGRYQYYEYEYVEGDKFSGPHWEPRRISGHYPSADFAEREALTEFSWLRGQLSN